MFHALVRRLCASRLASPLAALPLLLLSALAQPAAAQSLPSGFTEEIIATGLRQPLTMYFAPDGRIFVNERVGNLRIIRNNVLLTDPFLRLNVNLSVIRGLMAFAFDPNFSTNRFIYVYYNPPATETFQLSRFTAQSGNPDLVVPGSELMIYGRPYNTFDSTREILFGPDGKMYMGGAEGNIRRIDPLNFPNVIPSDNPTPGSDVWAPGLRNPSGLTFDPATGRLFANDAAWHAGQGGEKIREVFRGSAPIVYSYDHAESAGALTAGVFYRATHLPAQYQGSYFFVDHVQGTLRRRDPAGLVTVFATGLRYPVDIKVGPDGNLYYTDLGVLGAEFSPEFTNPSPTGTVRRLRYTPPSNPPPVVSFTNPAAGAALAGTVAVNAVANDPDAGTADGAGIANVLFELLQGTTVIATHAESTVTYDWSLDTTLYPNGAYTLRATATSTPAAGGTSTTVTRSVTIVNGGDSDGDGLPDAWETQYFGNLGQSGSADPDGDGLTNLQEFQNGADPTRRDTDGDGMPDGWEVQYGLGPANAADAGGDLDGDGYGNLEEYLGGSNPANAGSVPAPPISGGGGGGGGGCGATGMEALIVLGLSLVARRRG